MTCLVAIYFPFIYFTLIEGKNVKLASSIILYPKLHTKKAPFLDSFIDTSARYVSSYTMKDNINKQQHIFLLLQNIVCITQSIGKTIKEAISNTDTSWCYALVSITCLANQSMWAYVSLIFWSESETNKRFALFWGWAYFAFFSFYFSFQQFFFFLPILLNILFII